MTPHENKSAVRRRMLDTLRALSRERRDVLSASLRRALSTFRPLRDARTIVAFAPVSTEPMVDPLLDAWRAEGRRILLPRTLDEPGTMELVELEGPMCALASGPLGIRTPTGSSSRLREVDAILVPGVAFDPRGGRLGRGGGYYDRLLAELGAVMTIGVAFGCQIERELPREPHDRKVRYVATENEVLKCSGGSMTDLSK